MTEPTLAGFDISRFTHGGRTHQVYRAGSGPAVIVIHELPGIHPGMVDFARRIIGEGYTVWLPSLFGRPGQPLTGPETVRSILQVCISREFVILADRTNPAERWLRALAAHAHAECGGPGVGAIGMCFTGGFALAMAVESVVLAPVASQPGLPAPVTARRRAALGLDPADLAQIRERTRDGLCVLGLRFSHDKGCPSERFETLRRTLGDAFEGIEIDSSPGNPLGIRSRAHAVLTVDLVDEPGHPDPRRTGSSHRFPRRTARRLARDRLPGYDSRIPFETAAIPAKFELEIPATATGTLDIRAAACPT